MDIILYGNDLTMLRYLIPLADALHRVAPDEDLVFSFSTERTKYNGLALKENLRIFKTILSTRPFLRLVESKGGTRCDVLITVECVGWDRFDYGRHYAIQHGFDYWSLAKAACHKTTYLMSSPEYARDLWRRHRVGAKVPPRPVSFWNIEKDVSLGREQLKKIGHHGERLAFLFYPDRDYQKEARNAIDSLASNGFFVLVKQRRKHQAVPRDIPNVIYDDCWYPSEAIYFPALSNLTAGFGTSAFTDLVPAGVTFIEFELSHSSKEISEFLRPSAPNYAFIPLAQQSDFPSFLEKTEKRDVTADSRDVDMFVRRLLGGNQ